jgi:hypothetical protein
VVFEKGEVFTVHNSYTVVIVCRCDIALTM